MNTLGLLYIVNQPYCYLSICCKEHFEKIANRQEGKIWLEMEEGSLPIRIIRSPLNGNILEDPAW